MDAVFNKPRTGGSGQKKQKTRGEKTELEKELYYELEPSNSTNTKCVRATKEKCRKHFNNK